MLLASSVKKNTLVRSQTAVRLTRAALQAAYVVSEDLGTSIAARLFTSPRRYPRPERERDVLARGWRFSIDAQLRAPRWGGERRRLTAWRWGQGPTVLLVHGWEGRGSQLGAFVEPLVRAGFSVVAFDAPGHGDSPGRQLYLSDHADCVVDVARAVGPLHAIVAHSFGAAAVLLASRRGAAPAARSVLIAPNVLLDEALARFARTVALDDRDRAMLRSMLVRHTGIEIDTVIPEQLAGERPPPLLIVHDRLDREVSFANGERLAAAWPDATLHATEGLGHRRILRDAAVIDQTVAFVQQGVSPPSSELVREVDRLLSGAGM